MRYKVFGRHTGLRVSELVLGTGVFGTRWGHGADADEARRIHYNEAEKRGIYGEATREDAKALVEEGIEVHPLPVLPEEGN